jgi:hypothetical protein
MSPDFAKYLLNMHVNQRTGYVFKLEGTRTGEQMTSARAGRVISEIGELAGVLVSKAEGKFASAHDLRRSFGTRWAPPSETGDPPAADAPQIDRDHHEVLRQSERRRCRG